MKSMNDLMLHFLQDINYAEKLSVRGMAKMAKAAENPELRAAILEHRDQSQLQITRLEQVFGLMGKRARSKRCAAMDGLTAEVDEAISEGEKGPVLDSALIACAQAIEHYEIARYGALAAWARQVGMTEAAELLQQTLDEEKQADSKLNDIAEGTMNKQAAESGKEDDDESEDAEEMPEAAPAEEEKPAPRRRAAAASSRAAPAKKPGRSRAAATPEPEPEPAPAPRRRTARK